MVQEGTGGCLHGDLLTTGADVQAVEGLDRRIGLALSGPECREVMLSDENLRGLVHRIAVEPNGDMPDPIAGHGGGCRTVGDTIAVMTAGGREARMKLRINLCGGQDRDRFGLEVEIQGVPHRVIRVSTFKIDMNGLPQRMNTGIGPPGGVQRDGFATEPVHGPFQTLLYRPSIGLPLPAVKRRAIVFDDQLVAGHAPA